MGRKGHSTAIMPNVRDPGWDPDIQKHQNSCLAPEDRVDMQELYGGDEVNRKLESKRVDSNNQFNYNSYTFFAPVLENVHHVHPMSMDKPWWAIVMYCK